MATPQKREMIIASFIENQTQCYARRRVRRPVIAFALAFAALLPAQCALAQTQDAPLMRVPPARQCPDGAIFTGTQDFNPNAPDWTGYAYPWNLIYKEWMRIGGPNSPIGCPLGQSVTDSDGTWVQFEHGQIATSPGVWEQGVVAVYQDPIRGILVDWTVSWDDPSHYNYTKFIVRWDYKGPTDPTFQHYGNTQPFGKDGGDQRCSGDQCDVLADMGEVQLILTSYYNDTHLRTKGTFGIPADHGAGSYRVVIEGCDEGVVGSSTCRQGWMHSVTLDFRVRTSCIDNDAPCGDDTNYFPVDMRLAKTATDMASSKDQFFYRAAAFTLWDACRLLPWSAYRNEDDYGAIILAKLDYANYFQEDKCPGRVITNRQEAFDSLRQQRVESKPGTSTDSIPFRTGEYDVALTRYVAILNRFGGILPADVYDHILNDLLNVRSGLTLSDFYPFFPVPIPESENHLNNMESSRFLTNELLFARTGDSQYDNANNSVTILGHSASVKQFWLERLRNFMETDFIEYNARPYQGYSLGAIQNLAGFAKDPDVKLAAEMVLNYVSAKLAASSNDNRRVVPYRRRKDANTPALLGPHADPQSARMLVYVGDLNILKQANVTVSPGAGQELQNQHDFFGPWYGGTDAQMAITSSYRIPDLILDSILNPNHRLFYQGIHHYADEQYAGSPSYLISAGGHYASPAYTILGQGSSDDIGMALPTTVMPTGFSLSRKDLIRFEGSSDDTHRSNLCVAPDFACGINVRLPDWVAGLTQPCKYVTGSWTFIDFTANCRRPFSGNAAPEGFFAAVYQRPYQIVQIDGMNVGDSYGVVEVFDAKVNPGVQFDQFRQHVLDNNPDPDHRWNIVSRGNVYVTLTGRKITFELYPDSRIIDIDNGPALVQSTSDFATGSLFGSRGASGAVTFSNLYTGQKLTMDFSDVKRPSQTLTTIAAYQKDTCLPNFVWRQATGGDHVCVTLDIFKQTQNENLTVQSRVQPGTVDTCKQNYVWRLADPADHVCVTQASQDGAHWDNLLNLSRLAAPLP